MSFTTAKSMRPAGRDELVPAAQKTRSGTKNHTLAAAGRFKGFKPMEEIQVRQAEVKKDEKLEMILNSWREFCKIELGLSPVESNIFKNACALIGTKGVKAPDVERFSLMLPAYQDDKQFDYKAGLFLGALVEMAAGSSFTIRTRGLSTKPSHIGCFNRKFLTIDGGAGPYLGYGMRSGAIRVRGSAGPIAGMNMKGGKIFVYGRVGHSLGLAMQGGEMHVGKVPEKERCRLFDNVSEGKIYVAGELVVDRILIRVRRRLKRNSEYMPKAKPGAKDYPEWMKGE
jgi:hypothetical protein